MRNKGSGARRQKREAKRLTRIYLKAVAKEAVKNDMYLKYDKENKRWVDSRNEIDPKEIERNNAKFRG